MALKPNVKESLDRNGVVHTVVSDAQVTIGGTNTIPHNALKEVIRAAETQHGRISIESGVFTIRFG